MSKVHILPAEIVSKIAAGEVIERPSSVVKELLENALDAQSESIAVQLKNAGKSSIRIKDTGTGIQEADLDKIFSRHATSKISKLEDLYNINSLGFRGEALYSIAAVADITVWSKTADQDTGWQIHLRGNETLSKKPVTINQGTEIEVQELFFNTPARKKFLKSNTAELNHILDIFIPYTLLYPEISFVLRHNDRTVLELAPAKNIITRIAEALHLEKKHILEGQKEFPEQNLSIALVLGDINIQRTRKDMQFIYVNNRPVQNRTISFHLNEIYRLLFSRGVYPFFCAYINLPAQNLDVNVHPTKREVKIKDELELISRLRPFCENLLMTQSKAKQAEKHIFSIPAKSETKTTELETGSVSLEEENFIQKQSQCEKYRQDLKENILLFKTDDIFVRKKDDLKEKLKTSRYLGNLLRKYLLFETPDSLLVVDQHAAQERITFERLKSQLESGSVEIQHLATPILIKLSAQELLMWKESQENLANIGFQSSLFDKETLALHSHPQLITDPEISVRNLLSGENIAKCDMESLARRACRSSVMAGFSINIEQAQYQRDALLQCKDPFICPHGRPTVVEIPEPSLSKQFLRK
jgi:DNA mismatch repair protein MutL